jgi:hypothetical protein
VVILRLSHWGRQGAMHGFCGMNLPTNFIASIATTKYKGFFLFYREILQESGF